MSNAAAIFVTPGTEAAPFRRRLASASDGPLLFGAVREDPEVEIEVLRPSRAGRVAVVSSGGCTALSLLASGAHEVVAVDVNASQNHLVELKHAAVRSLGARDAVTFFGLAPTAPATRLRWYARLRSELTAEAACFWDAHPALVATGVQHAGRSERFLRLLARVVRGFVHPGERITRLLSSPSVEEQRRLYEREWNNRRWRLLFRLLLNRATLGHALDRACVERVPEGRLDRLVLDAFSRGLTTLPVSRNYFLHEMLAGRYPAWARPPYLTTEGAARLAAGTGRLRLVDGSFTDLLRTQEERSLSGIALSNVFEWLSAAEIEALFAQIVRVARPGAMVLFRNFLGWTEVPEAFRSQLVEDRARGEALVARDRSLVQRRIAVCTARPRWSSRPDGDRWLVRPARPEDNLALQGLATRCPMEGDLTLCVERAPDFFALNRLEGRRALVLVAERGSRVAGCIALSERLSHLGGRATRTLYVSDLKVDPEQRGCGVANALVAGVRDLALHWADANTLILATVLAGNRAMERRLDGPRGLPPLGRFATIRALAIPALRGLGHDRRWRIAPAQLQDVEEMLALWRGVAPGRQLAPVHHDPDEFVRWVESAPGLGLRSYRLARDEGGRLHGFLAVWEQSALKQLRVLEDSPRLAWSRPLLAGLGPLLGLPSLARPGEALRCAAVFGLCVPPERPQVLRALLRHALGELRRAGVGFLNLGLDARDPLLVATRGLLGLPTVVHAYACTPVGRWEGAALDDRPLHFETALV